MAKELKVGASDGELLLSTGVTGRAARTGHRLTILVETWTATVEFDDDQPSAISAAITVDSLKVLTGEGGLTPMTSPEKAVARGNALRSLQAEKFPSITYRSRSVTATDAGYRTQGSLTIHGKARPHPLDLTVTEAGDGHRIGFDTTASHAEFGIKPYSLMMGTLKVADEVRITMAVTVAR